MCGILTRAVELALQLVGDRSDAGADAGRKGGTAGVSGQRWGNDLKRGAKLPRGRKPRLAREERRMEQEQAWGWIRFSLERHFPSSCPRRSPSWGLSALGQPGELVNPELVLAQHLRPHDRPDQPRQQPSLGLLGDDLPLGAVRVEKSLVMRGRAESLPGPGEPPEPLVLGDLGRYERAEGDPGEAASDL